MRTARTGIRRKQVQRVCEDRADDGSVTVAGGPLERIDLMDILARGVSRAGAVSGAAQHALGAVPDDLSIALSDGSRINFSCFTDAGSDGAIERRPVHQSATRNERGVQPATGVFAAA